LVEAAPLALEACFVANAVLALRGLARIAGGTAVGGIAGCPLPHNGRIVILSALDSSLLAVILPAGNWRIRKIPLGRRIVSWVPSFGLEEDLVVREAPRTEFCTGDLSLSRGDAVRCIAARHEHPAVR
jgi:hypothetical protein